MTMVDMPSNDFGRDVPERYFGNKDFTREQNNQVYQKAVDESNRKDGEWMAKLAVLASGAHILGRFAGRNVFADMADIAGAGARFLGGLNKGKPKIEFADNLYRALNIPRDSGGATVKVSKGAARLDSYSRIQDLGDALGFLYDPKNASNRTHLEKLFTENFAELHRSGPGAKTPSFFHHDLERLTFGELIERQQEFVGHVGGKPAGESLEIGIVQKALELNLVKRNQIVDANLFKSKTGKIIDTRMMRPANLVENIADVFNPFGLVSSIKGFIGSERLFADLGPNKKTKNSEFFLNKKVFAVEGVNQITEKADDQTLGRVNDARFVPASLREDPSLAKAELNPDAGFIERLQDKLGVGTKYHEKRGGFFQTIFQSVRNARGVANGEAVVYGRDYKYTHDSLFKRIVDPLIPEGETTSGHEFHRGKYTRRGVIEPDDLTPIKGPFKGVRGFFNRLKTYAGMNEDAVLIKAESAGEERLSKEDLYTDFGRAGIASLERVSGISKAPTSVTTLGDLDYIKRPKYYAASNDIVDKSYDLANWMAIRLNKLASVSLAGIGFRPSGNLIANVARVAAVPAAYYTAFETARYADYLAGEAIGEKPSEIAADIYTSARVAQQKARESLGISQAAAYTEDQLLPGFSTGAVGTVVAAATFLKGMDKPGLAKTLAKTFMAYTTVGGPDVRQSSESLEREYSGEEKVPIRKARWWTLGYQPFEGGEIDYFAPSWYARMKSQPYLTSVYGSEEGYWNAGSALPTPSNMFGLSWLIDPYKVERQNYYDRPYPTTAKMFEEVPIVGPLLADTVGEIIKPTKTMHPSEQAYMVASSNITDKGIPTNSAKQLGIPELPASLIDLDSTANVQDRMEKWANVGLEPTGVWKYALGLFGVKFDSDYNMADAGNMSSVGRFFYDLNLGGMLGETELVRRFLLSEYSLPSKINQQINPIKNTMPRWLPGLESEYEGDRSYFTDFTRGDAYTKIPGGEFRLPGRGYESVNRLESGVSGIYSDVDRFLVLSDVAPFSSAYYEYEKKVLSKELSPYWKFKVSQAQEQRRMQTDRFYQMNKTSQLMAAKGNELGITKTIKDYWLKGTQGILAEKPIIGSKLFPFQDPYRIYLKEQVEGDTYADWNYPYESIIRPTIYDVIGQDPFTATTKALSIGAIISSPMASFLNPFPAIKANPFATTIAIGAAGGAGSLARMGHTETLEHGFVPQHVTKERETKEYFDYVDYVKYRNLQAKAEDMGNQRLANTYANKAKKTITYGKAQFESTGDDTRYRGSLSRDERPFYEQFLKAPINQREKILSVVPQHMKEVLSAQYRGAPVAPTDIQKEADADAIEYFQSHTLPNNDWAGWHPSVPSTAIRVKAVQGGINGVSDNMHRFGFFPAQQKEVENRFPDLESLPTNINSETAGGNALMLKAIFGSNDNPFRGFAQYTGNTNIGRGTSVHNATLRDHRRDDVFAFFTEVYR